MFVLVLFHVQWESGNDVFMFISGHVVCSVALTPVSMCVSVCLCVSMCVHVCPCAVDMCFRADRSADWRDPQSTRISCQTQGDTCTRSSFLHDFTLMCCTGFHHLHNGNWWCSFINVLDRNKAQKGSFSPAVVPGGHRAHNTENICFHNISNTNTHTHLNLINLS